MEFAARENATNSAAVERVLDAERTVEEQVRRAIEDADLVARSAHAHGEAIRKRTDDRISRLNVAMEVRIETEIAQLRKEFLGGSPNDLELGVERDALRRAVRRLAARMTGEIDEGLR